MVLENKDKTRFWTIFKIVLNLAFQELSELIIKFVILLMTNDYRATYLKL